jgi:hypothetical protein
MCFLIDHIDIIGNEQLILKVMGKTIGKQQRNQLNISKFHSLMCLS